MGVRWPVLVLLSVGLLAGCVESPASTPSTVLTAPVTVAWVGPSGLEVESERAARAAVDEQRAEAERLAVEAAAAQAAEAEQAERAERAEETERAEQAEQAAAERAAAAQATADTEGGAVEDEDDGQATSDLEVRCSDGTATIEECFGPGSDLNDNGIADVNE
jgi:hypothetical protein